VCKILHLNSKRLLRKLQKILGGYFILPHPVDDHRESAFLFLIQRFNAVAVLGTFAPTTPEEEV